MGQFRRSGSFRTQSQEPAVFRTRPKAQEIMSVKTIFPTRSCADILNTFQIPWGWHLTFRVLGFELCRTSLYALRIPLIISVVDRFLPRGNSSVRRSRQISGAADGTSG